MAGIFSLAFRTFPRNVLNVTSQVKVFQRGCVILRKHKVQTKPVVNAQPQLLSLNISRNFKTTSSLLEVKIVVVPPFAESVADGDVKWQKQKGDQVVEDEVVVEIETDKTSVPVPAPAAGIIEELLVEEDATVKSGTPLFKIKITGK